MPPNALTYLGAVEHGARTDIIGDHEGVLGEGVQDSTRIVKEFEGLVAGVDDGRGDLQVVQSIDLEVFGRGVDGQAGYSRDGDSGSNESNESSTEGGRHRWVKTSVAIYSSCTWVRPGGFPIPEINDGTRK